MSAGDADQLEMGRRHPRAGCPFKSCSPNRTVTLLHEHPEARMCNQSSQSTYATARYSVHRTYYQPGQIDTRSKNYNKQ